MLSLLRFLLLTVSFTLLSFNAAAKCEIDRAWLNLNYDHKIDYQNRSVETDFFLLMFSNSKRFCDHMARKGKADKVKFQCQSPNEFGWVVHGLWGESEAAYITGNKKGHPRFCQGDLPKVSLDKMTPFLCISPGLRLLQGEWEKHGACDFPSFTAYYQQTQQLYQRFQMPPADLKPKSAMRWMKKHHPELKDKWLHVDRREFGICFNKQFDVISCPKQKR